MTTSAIPPSRNTLRLGIDLGGTKTEAVVLDPKGQTLERWRQPSPRGDYAATLEMLCAIVTNTEARLGLSLSVGIGIPGTVSAQTGLVKNANSTWLIGQPLQADLLQALNRPISITNDANCFALSEATDGAGLGASVVWALILGTGVGSGIVFNGQILTGRNAIAGEWGHNPLPTMPNDPPTCYCGRQGCIETFLSGPGILRDHNQHGGQEESPQDILLAAKNNSPVAQATLQRYATRLAQSTAEVINILDPDVIILGGGLSNMDYLYASVPKLWPEYVFSDDIQTKLLPPLHGDSSGVRGAAWLGSMVTTPR